MSPSLPDRPHSIALFRALNLGDLLCFTPALRSVRRTFPFAKITLIGLESVRPLMRRLSYVDDFVVFPGHPAFPEQSADEAGLVAFYAQMRARKFDLALQLHGSGTASNEIVQSLGARSWAGFVPRPDQEEAGRLMLWPDELPEPERYLSLLRFLGFEVDNAELEFPLSDSDELESSRVAMAARLTAPRTIFLHPGARLPSRRWPAERFAGLALKLCDDGWQTAITGDPNETELVAAVCRATAGRAVNLAGATSLGGLGALLRKGRMLICNDTGVSHLAAALKVPSVVVASGSDVARWAPQDQSLHPVLWSPAACRPCAFHVCPTGHECAMAITVNDVYKATCGMLSRISSGRVAQEALR